MSLVLPPIAAFNGDAAEAAQAHQATLTKPPGSLGRLERLAVWYAGVRGCFPVPVPDRAELLVFAADHGVVAEGVSAYPAAVTAAMVANFRAGGAAVNVLARQCGVDVTVVDVGVHDRAEGSQSTATGDHPPAGPAAPEYADAAVGFVSAPVRSGTRNMRLEAAMSRAEAEQAFAVGLRLARAACARGASVLLGGEMGIGNSTVAAALLCGFGGDDPRAVTGRGTGIDDAALARKAAVVRDALARRPVDASDAWGVLSEVGGLEIAGLAGLMVGGASARVPVIVDGFIAGAAALVATRLVPGVRPFLLLSHLSAERGARRLCTLLGDPGPLFDFDMRLGEGTGAVLAVPILRAAVAAQVEMATFTSAAIPSG